MAGALLQNFLKMTTSITKTEKDQDPNDDEAGLGKSKTLNAIYNEVDKNFFRLINIFVSANEAWEIMKTSFEGTYKVKNSRLQPITIEFKNLNMLKKETINVFDVRVLYL